MAFARVNGTGRLAALACIAMSACSDDSNSIQSKTNSGDLNAQSLDCLASEVAYSKAYRDAFYDPNSQSSSYSEAERDFQRSERQWVDIIVNQTSQTPREVRAAANAMAENWQKEAKAAALGTVLELPEGDLSDTADRMTLQWRSCQSLQERLLATSSTASLRAMPTSRMLKS